MFLGGREGRILGVPKGERVGGCVGGLVCLFLGLGGREALPKAEKGESDQILWVALAAQ